MDNKLINENRVCHPHLRVNSLSLSIEPSFTFAAGYNSPLERVSPGFVERIKQRTRHKVRTQVGVVHRVWRVTHKRLLAVTSNE